MRFILSAALGLLAIGLLYGVLVVPAAPGAIAGAQTLWPLPVELAVIVFVTLALPARSSTAWRALVAAAVALLATVKLADLGTYAAFNRPFNPLLDTHLPRDGWNILSHSLGVGLAAVAVLAALLIVLILLLVIGYGLGRLRHGPTPVRHLLMAVSVVLIVAACLQAVPGTLAIPEVANARTSIAMIDRGERIAASAADLSEFKRQLAASGAHPNHADESQRLDRLAGQNVLLVFVESYGRTVFERPLYADVIGPQLAAFENDIRAAGFEARSGWLTSPTFGGQSWLAHGTLLSGLWVDSQPRYDALVASKRPSLNRVFARAGWRTSAVMPAITRDWPEAAWFGYDRVFASGDLGYAGQPFNWVTMPDQYTLTAIKREILDTPAERPAMIETALISSHAPWTPIPPLLDWADIGNGRIFSAYASVGDPPEVVWQDYDRVRAQYRKAIDYSLKTLASFIATQADDDLVLIILGDHQPAPLVTGDNASRDVPMHIIAQDPDLLAAMDHWRWTPGMMPDDQTPVWPMDAFYERFIDAFSTGDTSAD